MTTTIPNRVPYTLPTEDARNYEWTYSGKTLFHNLSSTEHSYPNLDDCEVGNKVGLLITSSRELHLFFDEKFVCKLATGLPVEKPVFGTVDVKDHCCMIKSEILSGELDGVYIIIYFLCFHISSSQKLTLLQAEHSCELHYTQNHTIHILICSMSA